MSGSLGRNVTDPLHNGGSGCLSSDDLGVWSATEAPAGEACTAATMNAEVLAVSSLVNSPVAAPAP